MKEISVINTKTPSIEQSYPVSNKDSLYIKNNKNLATVYYFKVRNNKFRFSSRKLRA